MKHHLLPITIISLVALLSLNSEAAKVDSPFGFHPASAVKTGYASNGFIDAEYIGVKWHRPTVYAAWNLVQKSLTDTTLDFSMYDQSYRRVPEGINILGNITVSLGNDSYQIPGSYFPVDSVQYKRFVTKLVERYDGDGKDDMPGLVNPVRYWQVGNEPTFIIKDFAELMKITYLAAKVADSSVQMMIGGVSSFPSDYIQRFNKTWQPILSTLGGKYIDIMDFHWYGTAGGEYRFIDTKTGQDAYNRIRQLMDSCGYDSKLPVWVTEMGSYSGDPKDITMFGLVPLQTEAQQALDYLKRHVYSFARGVKKIFPAFGLMEGFKQDDGYFDHTGLIYDGALTSDLGLGVKKLGYYSYKLMTEKLEGVDLEKVVSISDGSTDNIHTYRFVKSGGTYVYVAWWDYFLEDGFQEGDKKTLSLDSLNAQQIVRTVAVPGVATGNEVTAYETAFLTDTNSLESGKFTFELSTQPVFLEPHGTLPLLQNNFSVSRQVKTSFGLGQVTLESLTKSGISKVSIYSPDGRLLFLKKYDHQQKIVLNTGTLEPGILLVTVKMGDIQQLFKLAH
ncbi:MAG: T9SS type A sorting domain-containing protein [Fibrobacteria bacterium]|nr:T9SS type A sorting domain-containing protein [Fibrobacteria bacterium]